MESMQRVTSSNWWLLTSPHKVLDENEIRFLDGLYQSENLFDYCRCTELEPGADEPHVHVALRFGMPIVPWFGGSSQNLHGWNIESPILAGDEAWERMLEYVKKTGNYYHKREIIPYPYNIANPIWKPWQQYILDYPRFNRKIIIVLDEIGGIGKTFLAGWHDVRHKAILVPPMDSHRDIMRMINSHDMSSGMVFIDVPRALSRRQMRGIYAAAESIKDGKSYDERYEWHVKRFDTPKVVIFTNDMPDKRQLSLDRWIIIKPHKDGTFEIAD